MKPLPHPTFFYRKSSTSSNKSGFTTALILLFLSLLSFFAGAVGSLFFSVYFFDTIFSNSQGKSPLSLADILTRVGEQTNQDMDQLNLELVQNIAPSVGAIIRNDSLGQGVFVLPHEGFLGDAVFVTSDGFMVSNSLVWKDQDIRDPSLFRVVTHAGSVLPVQKIFSDPLTDLIWLRVDTTQAKPVSFIDSSDVKPGIATFSFSRSVSDYSVFSNILSQSYTRFGDVVQKSESSPRYVLLSQTQSAPAGTPVFSRSGALIGIMHTVSDNGQPRVIPALSIRSGLLSLLDNQATIQRPFLGIQYIHSPSELGNAVRQETFYRVGDTIIAPESGGAAITPDSPADRAGLLAGDRILRVGEDVVEGVYDTNVLLNHYRPGDTITLSIDRSGEILSIPITLSSLSFD